MNNLMVEYLIKSAEFIDKLLERTSCAVWNVLKRISPQGYETAARRSSSYEELGGINQDLATRNLRLVVENIALIQKVGDLEYVAGSSVVRDLRNRVEQQSAELKLSGNRIKRLRFGAVYQAHKECVDSVREFAGKEGVLVLSRRGVVKYQSEAIERLLGNLKGKRIGEIVYGENSREIGLTVDHFMNSTEPGWLYAVKGEEKFPVEIKVIPRVIRDFETGKDIVHSTVIKVLESGWIRNVIERVLSHKARCYQVQLILDAERERQKRGLEIPENLEGLAST